MTFFETARRAVSQQMMASHAEIEAWKLDHERAMLVFDFQELVTSVTHQFDTIDGLNRQLTDDIINRTQPYLEAFDEGVKDLCREWLTLARDMRDGVMAWCKSQGHEVDGEREFLDRIAQAEISEANDFELYAKQRIASMQLQIDKIQEMQIPMALWPD